MKTMSLKKMISFGVAILLLLMITSLSLCMSSCGIKRFTVYPCGSGFYFNRAPKKTYEIKGLGLTSDQNYFYLEDYFCSETLGTKYTIKRSIFPIGSVCLAKKADHYNPEKYEFNLDELDSDMIQITPEMNYVRIFSSSPSTPHDVYIEIQARTLPVDITLEDANLYTSSPMPVILSASPDAVNFVLKGSNSIAAGNQTMTQENYYAHLAESALTARQEQYYSTLQTVYSEVEYLFENGGQNSFSDYFNHYVADNMMKFFDWELSAMEGLWNTAGNILVGKTGSDGVNGIAAIVHFGGVSFSGTGTLCVTGGGGSNGGDASSSVTGNANGGNGGQGGAGICCFSLLVPDGVDVILNGGAGGRGGEPSKGLFGLLASSGKPGNKGKEGNPQEVATPRAE